MQIEIVPEPSSAAALLGLCSITVACLRRRRD
ncbi:PEP-CTERM sorting domain-containing protein [Thalassobacterium maritimum]